MPRVTTCLIRNCPILFAVFLFLGVVWIHFAVMLESPKWKMKEFKSSAKLIRPHDLGDDQSVQVLIVAYFRSGSTFTSSTLSRLNGSFFVFEPLHVLREYLLETHRDLTFINGKTRPAIIQGYEGPYQEDVIQALLNCDLENIDTATLMLGFLPMFTWQIQAYLNCTKRTPVLPETNQFRHCLDILKESCRSAPTRVVKTIRISMESVGRLLDKIPRLKVIHLIRDPRGQFASGVQHARKKAQFYQQKVCNKVSNDIKTRQQLELKYPRSFHEVIYEDLAQNPYHTVQRIYDFLGLSLPYYVIKWLRDTTSSSSGEHSYLGTRRANSTETAYGWLKVLPWSYVSYFQTKCSWLLNHGKFPFITSPEELKQFTIPHRPKVE